MSQGKLVLHKETLNALSSVQSEQVQGGVFTLEYQCNTEGACIPFTAFKCTNSGIYCG